MIPDSLPCSELYCDHDGQMYLSGPAMGESGRCLVIAGPRGRQLWAQSHFGAHYLCREHAENYIGEWLSQAETLAEE